jgi:hypothetical protein
MFLDGSETFEIIKGRVQIMPVTPQGKVYILKGARYIGFL